MIKDSFIGVLIFCILNGGGISVFREQLLAYGDLYGAEQDKIEAFQKYVSENQLKMTDTDEIRSWVRQRNIQEFVSQRERIFFLIIPIRKIYFQVRYKRVHQNFYVPYIFQTEKQSFIFMMDLQINILI